MDNRLFVGVLGNRNSGKSTTWNTLFGANVRTGQNARRLTLNNGKCVDVFLINGSPEERDIDIRTLLKKQDCQIILCSIQYTESVRMTLDYITHEGYEIFVQWLNPGYTDSVAIYDRLGLTSWLLEKGATISMRNGKSQLANRTEEIRAFIHGWATAQYLTFDCR